MLFPFKSQALLKMKSFRERALYKEHLLADLYAQRDEAGELERQNLARIALRKLINGETGSKHSPG